MGEYLTTTVSACKKCGKLLPARVHLEESGTWLHKICPEHGEQKALVYSYASDYLDARDFFSAGSQQLASTTEFGNGCPDSCGLCPEHEQHVCMPVIEITDHCDLSCPICLIKNRSSYHLTRADVGKILDELIRTEGQIDVANLSGGEPTVNPDFREIVEECLSRKEILRVSVSTNGLNLARDASLLRFLAERNVVISLQFDGFEESIYEPMRGSLPWKDGGKNKSLLRQKLDLIDHASELDAPMSLTATIKRGINDRNLGKIVELLFSRKNILSTMFQPAVYTSGSHAEKRPEDAISIPDIIRLLDGAAGGTIKSGNFSPLPCSHPACFYLAFYLRVSENEFVSLKGLVEIEKYVAMIRNRALFGTDPEGFRAVQDAIYDLWSGPCALAPDSQRALTAAKKLITAATCGGFGAAKAVGAAERQIKSVFIHQFMDRDTFDLSRVRKCCTVYPQKDGKAIPCCVHNCLKR